MISDDAKVVFARLCGESRVGREITLPMKGERATRRCAKALSELAGERFIRIRNESPVSVARVITVLKDPREVVRWLKRQEHNQDVDFQLMERI